ncbi:MAG: N,N-dimethylformamidase [Alphaproteobacteria bacterium]|nr:N,N-dimethylformamidase [Alphaproteobacteria bacterium]
MTRGHRLLGYGDEISVTPRATLRFMVSAEGLERYRADIVRLRCADDSPGGPGFSEIVVPSAANGDYRARFQPILAGSYAIVPENQRLLRLSSLTAQAFIWATTPRLGPQAILGTWSQGMGSGFALVIEGDGCLGLRLAGRGGDFVSVTTGVPVPARTWLFVAATFDAGTGQTVLYQEPVDPGLTPHRPTRVAARVEGARADSGGRLLVAAWTESQRANRPTAGGFFNGRIEAPRLADRALDPSQIQVLKQPIPPIGLGEALIGCWDFARDIPATRIVDVGPNKFHGQTVNLPTRAVRGHRWTGAEMNWRYAPEQYAAIHFHDDDLYDCGWETDFELTIPGDWPSGCYAARLRADGDEEYIPFFVRPETGRPTADAVYIASTATYQAYANGLKAAYDQASESVAGQFAKLSSEDVFLSHHPEFGGSTYDTHRDGTGICHASRLRPMLDVRPRSHLWTYDADSLIVDWLAAKAIPCDVITDEDLDAEGAGLLKPYRVVLTGRQPEYVSTRMWDGLAGYLKGGGRLMYLGGNGFYWRIAFHPQLKGVLEVRRAEGGTRAWSTAPGEAYHSFTGEHGGLWRRQGRPPNLLTGVGFTGQGFDTGTHYRRTAAAADPRAAFIFDGVDGDVIGDHGAFGGAAGIEVDRFDRGLGSPPHALVVARSENHSAHWQRVIEEFLAMHPMVTGQTNALLRADMTFFETPAGGAVFSVGSIAWGGSLATDGYANDVSRITENVLRRFLESQSFPMPPLPDDAPGDPDVAGTEGVVEGFNRPA